MSRSIEGWEEGPRCFRYTPVFTSSLLEGRERRESRER